MELGHLGPQTVLPDDRRDGPWHSAFEHAPVGIAVCSPAGVALQVNPALAELLGRDVATLVGRDFFSITYEADVAAARAACRDLQLNGGSVSRHESRFEHAAGHLVSVHVSTSTVYDRDGRATHLVMHVEDISERKALEAELLRRAEHDMLTGLLNRSSFVDRLHRTLERSGESTPTSLLFVDLDDFKVVNDAHGHAVGDLWLVEVAGRLRHVLRPGDLLSRFGGDEFTIVCPDTDEQAAHAVAKRLTEVMAEPMTLDDVTLAVSATVGRATLTRGAGADASALLAAADADMYARKRARSH